MKQIYSQRTADHQLAALIIKDIYGDDVEVFYNTSNFKEGTDLIVLGEINSNKENLLKEWISKSASVELFTNSPATIKRILEEDLEVTGFQSSKITISELVWRYYRGKESEEQIVKVISDYTRTQTLENTATLVLKELIEAGNSLTDIPSDDFQLELLTKMILQVKKSLVSKIAKIIKEASFGGKKVKISSSLVLSKDFFHHGVNQDMQVYINTNLKRSFIFVPDKELRKLLKGEFLGAVEIENGILELKTPLSNETKNLLIGL